MSLNKCPSRINWRNWYGQKVYARLQSDCEEEEGTRNSALESTTALPTKCRNRSTLKFISIVYMILSSTTLLFLTVSFHQHHRDLQPSLSSADSSPAVIMSPCGNTPAAARAAGCIFDIMAFSWLPPRCHDAELAEEFRKLKGWEYFIDLNRTRPLSQELALTGEFAGLYTEFEYHLRHCTFLWKKMHRALLSGGGGKMAIDSVTAGYSHTEHCSHMLMTRREVALDVINAVIVVKYPDCGME